MHAQIWVVSTLLISIVLIVLHREVHSPLSGAAARQLLRGSDDGDGAAGHGNAIENGIGGTLGSLAAVMGLGTILGKT
jgi:D-serine transporter